MSTTDLLQEEINLLRSQLEESTTAKEKLEDERSQIVNQYEEEFILRRKDLQDKSDQELTELRESQDHQINTLSTQLEQMHRAFSGDACGWKEKVNKRTKAVEYVNSETQETATDKPMIMQFAQRVQSIESADTDKNELKKAQDKAKDTETSKRRITVQMNETRSEITNVKRLLKNWEHTSVELSEFMGNYGEDMATLHENVMLRIPDLQVSVNQVTITKEKVVKACKRIEKKNDVIDALYYETVKLKREGLVLKKDWEEMSAKVKSYEDEMADGIEAKVRPLRMEVASSYAMLMKEKAGRTEDRVELADLWPPGWLMPSVLVKFKTLNEKDKEGKRQAALELEAERFLKEDIRARVIEASKWTAQFDDYGQTFYQHADTGESEWETPEAMSYTPPNGRDEMGNVIKTASPELDEDEAAEVANWDQITDEWGQSYFTHKITGETSWEAPPGFVVEKAVKVVDSKDKAIEAARAVIDYFKTKLPEVDKDGEEEELVYDMQAVEELARGKSNWTFEKPKEVKEAEGDNTAVVMNHVNEEISMLELRELVYVCATQENDLEANLRRVRHDLSKLSHRLLEKKKTFDVEELAERRAVKMREADEAASLAKLLAEQSGDEEDDIDDLSDTEAKPVAVKKIDRFKRTPPTPDRNAIVMAEAKRMQALPPPGSPKARKQTSDDAQAAASPKSSPKPSYNPESEIPPANVNVDFNDDVDEHEHDTIEAKIKSLKSTFEDPKSEPAQEDPAILSLEVGEMLADQAAPMGKVHNKAIQALAIQAVWSGFSGQPLAVPPKEVIGDVMHVKWGTAAFFATLDLNSLDGSNNGGEDEVVGSAGFLKTPAREFGERPLPGQMYARDTKRKFLQEVSAESCNFLREAAVVADQEQSIDISNATLQIFTKSVARGGEDEGVRDSDASFKRTETERIKDFNQRPKGVGAGTAGKISQMDDEEPPGKMFPDPDADMAQLMKQAESRKEQMEAILTNERLSSQTVWLAKKAGERAERRAIENDNHNDNGVDDLVDGFQDEKKSSSPRGESGFEDGEADEGSNSSNSSSNDFHRSISTVPPPPQVIIPIQDIDAIKLTKEEAILHDNSIKPLLDETDRLRDAVWEDHYNITKFWACEIHNSEEEVVKLSKVLMEAQAFVSKLEGELKGLSISTSAPKKPNPPGAAPQVGKPPNVKIGSAEVNAGSMMPEREFQKLISDIKQRVIYVGKAVKIEEGVVITADQNAAIEREIDAKNAILVTETEDYARSYDERMANYVTLHKVYLVDEADRVLRYNKVRYQMRILHLKNDYTRSIKESFITEIARYNVEAGVEMKRGKQLTQMVGRSETERVKQVIEHFRGPETIAFLQDQLIMAMEQRNRAMALPDAATSILHRMELEDKRALMLKELRMTIAWLREQLINEGRRRKFLYEEEFASIQREVRVIREENAQAIERSNSLRVVKSLIKLDRLTKEAVKNARVVEATSDSEGLDVTGLNGEIYAEDKKWLMHEVVAAMRESVDVGRCLGAALEARTLARYREDRSRESNSGNATSIPPHAEQWLPEAERARLVEENEWAAYNSVEKVRISDAAIANERVVAVSLRGQIEVLNSKLEASEAGRSEDVRVIRHTADEAFELLHRNQKEKVSILQLKEKRLELDLSNLSTQLNETQDALGDEIEHLKSECVTNDSLSVFLRYELSDRNVRLDLTTAMLEKVKGMWSRDTDALKVQLRGERNHTARLELWIAAMHDDVKYYLKEIKLREQWLAEQKKAGEVAASELKYERWTQTTAIYALGCNVDSLFLFFIQRIVNLAGSREEYNDDLRNNGAMNILAAFCQSPRKELRRLAARALGSMGWNGFVEQRLLGWDVIRGWKLWTDFVVPLELEKLKKLGKTFEDKVRTGNEEKDREEDANADADGEFKPQPNMSLRAVIRARRQWALRKARRREGPNEKNQLMLGTEKNVLRLLLDLCRVKEWDVVRYATLALSVAAHHEANSEVMGRTKNCIETVVRLCRSGDEEIQTQAAATIANLGYASQRNQQLIGNCGGIEALVDVCRGSDVDVIEAGTAALANIVTLHTGNAVKFAECGGVDVLSHLVTSNQIVNLLDVDQISEIQANAAECLANVTRNYGKSNAARIHELGISPLVLMCGSRNLQVQRHAALVLGNIAQDDEQREVIGLRGGVEALMLLCEKEDEAVKANSLWALSNLGWHPLNQERIGRYLLEIHKLCSSDSIAVQANAIECLANALYFHDRNRERIFQVDGAVDQCVQMCTSAYNEAIQEPSLRAIVSLTYVDFIGVPLGRGPLLIPTLVERCKSSAPLVQKYAAMALLNLSVHDILKVRILDEGGVEALAGMQVSDNLQGRSVALQVLAQLADIRSIDHLAEQKAAFGIAGMLKLAQTDNALIQKLACESLAEDLWSNFKKQDEIVGMDGHVIIMNIIKKVNQVDDVMNPALWAIRNIVYDNPVNKSKVGRLQGVQTLIGICDSNKGEGKNGGILESALTALVNLVVDHEANSRILLKHGLDCLIIVAESYGKVALLLGPEEIEDGGEASENREALKSNAALATSLLQMVGPYNFLVCSNCGKEQLGGSTCENCGRAIAFVG